MMQGCQLNGAPPAPTHPSPVSRACPAPSRAHCLHVATAATNRFALKRPRRADPPGRITMRRHPARRPRRFACCCMGHCASKVTLLNQAMRPGPISQKASLPCSRRRSAGRQESRAGHPRPQKKKESADKPGFVVGSHSSGSCVAAGFKQPTRERRGPRHSSPIWSCSRWGLPCHAALAPHAVCSYHTVSPLPRTSCDAVRRFAFCCTFRRLAPPRRYLAPCPAEPGLSSPCRNTSRLPGRLQRAF